MLTRKGIEYNKNSAERFPSIAAEAAANLAADALAKHDALLEIYHLLGGEGEPEDVVEACKKRVEHAIKLIRMLERT